jgi:hypothetical protein
MKTVTPKTPEAVVRILKIASCPSQSGKSTLTYHIGCKDKTDIQIRVYANSSTGFFSNEWISFNAIQQAFAKVPAKVITSFVLYSLFQGKSINTPAFLFAALKAEGLVQPSKEEPRCFERTDPKGFLAGVKALIASSVDLKATDKPQKTAAKSKPAAVTKKTSSKSSK